MGDLQSFEPQLLFETIYAALALSAVDLLCDEFKSALVKTHMSLTDLHSLQSLLELLSLRSVS